MNISADFGITVTDTLRKSGDSFIHNMELSSNNLNHDQVKKLFPEVDFNSDDGFLAVTGGRHLELGNRIDSKPIIHLNEIDAIGAGSMRLSGLDEENPVIIVSAGSGTACIYGHKGKFTHCSGTGIGGGTILGLSKLLLGTIDPLEIAALAESGDEAQVDLILEDVVSGPIGKLPPSTTAVNFGKVSKIDKEYSKEDIAAGIISLVGQTIARIATSVATGFNAKQIIVVGRAPSFNGLKNSLKNASLITGFTPHFPENGEYASALGAMILAEKNPSNQN